MANDIRYTHDKYKAVADLTGIPYHQLFSKKSVLGKWLRDQNSVVQIGTYLFVHAGYSPELLTLNLSHTEINNQIRAALGPPAWPDKDHLSTSLAWHSKGPLWYRGYFEKHAKKYGPKPTDEELQSILTRHNAIAIIVGHTVTGEVCYLDGNKHLIGIDVHWDTPGQGQGLLIEDEKLIRLSMDGVAKELTTKSTKKTTQIKIPPVLGISPNDLQELLSQGSIILIDVREKHEFDAERIVGALNVPLSTFTIKTIDKIAGDKEVVFQCHSGHRSGIASKEYFNGKQSQKHVEGGIIAWKKEGYETVTK